MYEDTLRVRMTHARAIAHTYVMHDRSTIRTHYQGDAHTYDNRSLIALPYVRNADVTPQHGDNHHTSSTFEIN